MKRFMIVFALLISLAGAVMAQSAGYTVRISSVKTNGGSGANENESFYRSFMAAQTQGAAHFTQEAAEYSVRIAFQRSVSVASVKDDTKAIVKQELKREGVHALAQLPQVLANVFCYRCGYGYIRYRGPIVTHYPTYYPRDRRVFNDQAAPFVQVETVTLHVLMEMTDRSGRVVSHMEGDQQFEIELHGVQKSREGYVIEHCKVRRGNIAVLGLKQNADLGPDYEQQLKNAAFANTISDPTNKTPGY